jgi:hypothetical protein
MMTVYAHMVLSYGKERIQASPNHMDVRTVIKFHMLMGKMPCECHNMVKDNLEIQMLLHKTDDGCMPLMMDGKMQ